MQRECELNKCVNFMELPDIEEQRIFILYILDLLIIKADARLYNHLLYKPEHRHIGEHWLLYDNVHSHVHVMSDIHKFVGANFLL